MWTRYANGQGRHFRNLHGMQKINQYPTIIGCDHKAGTLFSLIQMKTIGYIHNAIDQRFSTCAPQAHFRGHHGSS